jgi:hypothetical protein
VILNPREESEKRRWRQWRRRRATARVVERLKGRGGQGMKGGLTA